MMYLTDRTKIAAAINFGEFPVLSINIENRPFEGSNYAKGCRVRVAWDNPEYKGMTTHGELFMEDDGRLGITGEGAMLTASFGYRDVMKMAAEANVPIIHKGQTVVVVMDIPSITTCLVRVMRVPDRIDARCQVVAYLEDPDNELEKEVAKTLRRIIHRR